MEYVMYAVFAFWYLCSLTGLAVVIQSFARGDQSLLRSRWYYFASFAFNATVTSVLLWLYSSGRLDAWSTVIIGAILFLPEAIFTLWTRGVFSGGKLQ